MTATGPATQAAAPRDPAGRPGTGRAVAALILVALAALMPLLGPSAALHGTGEAAAPGVGGIALLRGVLFAALCVPLGELFAHRLAARLPDAPPERPTGWAVFAAAAGLAAALALASVVATGNLVPRSLADVDVGGLYRSRDGRLALIEVDAFALAALCARARRPAVRVWPLAAVVLSEALRAHPAPETSPSTGYALTLVHLTCAALWAGGLLHVLRLLRRWRDAGAGAALLGLYARGRRPAGGGHRDGRVERAAADAGGHRPGPADDDGVRAHPAGQGGPRRRRRRARAGGAAAAAPGGRPAHRVRPGAGRGGPAGDRGRGVGRAHGTAGADQMDVNTDGPGAPARRPRLSRW